MERERESSFITRTHSSLFFSTHLAPPLFFSTGVDD